MKSSTEQRLVERIAELRSAELEAAGRRELVASLRKAILACDELTLQINEVASWNSTFSAGNSPLPHGELCDDAIKLIIQAKIVLYKIGGVE